MTVRKLTFALLLTFFGLGLAAQEAGSTYRSFTPKDQWEIGLDLGTPMVLGDIDADFPGFGGGLHIRKSLGHVFSVRVGGLYGSMKNENTGSNTDKSETTWFSGSGPIGNDRKQPSLRQALPQSRHQRIRWYGLLFFRT